MDPGRSDLARHRDLWALVNERFTDADAEGQWAADGIRWGLFRLPEAELGLLGDVRGLDIVELGCGSAFLSASLARAGARPVGVDLSPAQLDTARRCQRRHDVFFPLVEADAGQVPLRSGAFDLVVSEYGAAPWCDPADWLAEAARLLRPDGSTGVLDPQRHGRLVRTRRRWGRRRPAAARANATSLASRGPEEGSSTIPSHSDWIRLLRANGFEIDALHELFPPPDADAPGFYEIVTGDWATRWPAEDVWVAHRHGTHRAGRVRAGTV